MASAKGISHSRIPSTRRNRRTSDLRRRPARNTGEIVADRFAVCVRNDDYPASLELRKLYPIVEDDFAELHELLRVVDESGEDYLYPSTYFVRLDLPKPVERTLHRIA